MSVKLALLLLGPTRLNASWAWTAVLGVALATFGGFMTAEALDHESMFSIDMLGDLLLVIGAIRAVLAYTSPWDHGSPGRWLQAALLITLGIVATIDPNDADSVDLFALSIVFALLGVSKIAFSLVGFYPRWGFVFADGCLNFGMGYLLFHDWKRDVYWMAPLLFGVGLMLMGVSTLSTAWRLRRSCRLYERSGDAMCALDYFLRQHVSARYRQVFARLPPLKQHVEERTASPSSDSDAELRVHVWLPLESADHKIESTIPIFSAYVVVQDAAGCLSVGHAALEADPKVYISHYDRAEYEKTVRGDHEIDTGGDSLLSHTQPHDEEGAFFESHQKEVACWMPPNRTLKMPRHNSRLLQTYWDYYRRDSTYNLAQRNCSVSVVLALDVALLGCLRGPRTGWRFIRLLLNRNLWWAAFLRRRAEDLVWTPALVHDYATALFRAIAEEEKILTAHKRPACP
jgi:uncharacterized membrane protein HdeD (DUF308 family)